VKKNCSVVNIAFVSTFYPLRGGIAHFNTLLYQKLTERGHRVTAITFSRQYPKLFFPGKTQEEQGTEDDLYKTNAEVLLDSVNPLSWIQVGLRVYDLAPDVVLFKYWIPFFAPAYFVISLIAKLRSKTKVIYILDNFKPHETRVGDGILLWLATRLADGYVAMSDKVESDLKKEFPTARYEKSPHPIYNIFGGAISKTEARQKLGLSESQKVILFFGYIRSYKGLDLLLDAMPELTKAFPDLTLIIAGEFYGDEQLYRDKISSLGISNHLLLATDYIPNHDVSTYFCAADCAVLPYRSATQSGIVQIAYHFDLPSVVTNVGGLSEVVRDGKTGFVVEPNNSDAIVDGVKMFYESRHDIDFTANIRAEKKQYSWDAFAEAVERLDSKLRS